MANEKLTKQEFVDKYPYIVYTDMDTIVYSGKADTSIDDVPGGGGGVYKIHSVSCTVNQSEQTEYAEVESFVYRITGFDGSHVPIVDTDEPVTEANAGEILVAYDTTNNLFQLVNCVSGTDPDDSFEPIVSFTGSGDATVSDAGLVTFAMPAAEAWVIVNG